MLAPPPAAQEEKEPSRSRVFPANTTAKLCLSASILLFLFQVYRHWTYLEDDPLIVFRYALNFHAGHGWVMNPGEHVNGCTSFFGLILVTVLSKFLSLDSAIIALKILGTAAGIIVLRKSQQVAEALLPDAPLFAAFAPLLLAYRTDFSLAMTNGMETPYACVFFLCAFTTYWKAIRPGDATEKTERSGNPAPFHEMAGVPGVRLLDSVLPTKTKQEWIALAYFALAGFTRPELTIIYPALLFLRLSRREPVDLRLAFAYAIPFLCLGAFNLTYYHSLVPNTYYAKLVDIPTGLVEGGDYIAQYLLFPFAWIGGILSLVCLLVVASRQSRITEVYLLTLALMTAFLLRTSGDWMVDGRLAMPALTLMVASWLAGIQAAFLKLQEIGKEKRSRVAVACGAGALVLMIGGVYDNKMREAYIHQCSRIRPFNHTLQTSAPLSTWMAGAPDGRRRISDWLRSHAKPGECVVMPEMGLIPCLNPNINFIDMEGLTDAAIARMPIPHGPYGAHAGPDWDNLESPMGQYIEARRPKYVISAYTNGSVIRNPNYKRIASIIAYVDSSGKYRFIIYQRKI